MAIIDVVGIPRSGNTILYNLLREINKSYDTRLTVRFPAHQCYNKNHVRVGIIRNIYHVISSNIKIWKDSGFCETCIEDMLFNNQNEFQNCVVCEECLRNKNVKTLYNFLIDFLANINNFNFVVVYEPYFPPLLECLINELTYIVFGKDVVYEKTLEILNKYNIKINNKKYGDNRKFISSEIEERTLFKPGHISTKGEGSFINLNQKLMSKINENFLYKKYSYIHHVLLNSSQQKNNSFIYSKPDIKTFQTVYKEGFIERYSQ